MRLKISKIEDLVAYNPEVGSLCIIFLALIVLLCTNKVGVRLRFKNFCPRPKINIY